MALASSSLSSEIFAVVLTIFGIWRSSYWNLARII
jgi:hypothetical protein